MSSQSSLALVWLARSVVVADDVTDDSVAIVGGLAPMVLVATVFGPF